MVERAGFENQYPCKGIEGSNPSASAIGSVVSWVGRGYKKTEWFRFSRAETGGAMFRRNGADQERACWFRKPACLHWYRRTKLGRLRQVKDFLVRGLVRCNRIY